MKFIIQKRAFILNTSYILHEPITVKRDLASLGKFIAPIV